MPLHPSSGHLHCTNSNRFNSNVLAQISIFLRMQDWVFRTLGRQGCQMVYFTTKYRNLGKFWKMLTYFMAIWNILPTFWIFYDNFVHFVFIWYIFSRFGIMYQDLSGNPDGQVNSCSTRRRKKLFKWKNDFLRKQFAISRTKLFLFTFFGQTF
jgi:hypothetical protein